MYNRAFDALFGCQLLDTINPIGNENGDSVLSIPTGTNTRVLEQSWEGKENSLEPFSVYLAYRNVAGTAVSGTRPLASPYY